MINKIVTTRKPHNCRQCGNEIPAGSKAEYFDFRMAKVDEEGFQFGIYYARFYQHEDLACMSKQDVNFDL